MDDIERTLTAVKAWAERLIDTSRKNPLLYFRETRTTALFMAKQEVVDDLIEGKGLVPSDIGSLPLLSEDTTAEDGGRSENEVYAIFRNLHKKALLDREEKGVETLAVGAGFASWDPMDGGREPRAPVVLIPAEIRPAAGTLELRAAGDPRINPVLLHVLTTEMKASVNPDTLQTALDEGNGGSGDEAGINLEGVYEELRRACERVTGFTIAEGAGLGTFRYQRMAMVADLFNNQEGIAGHEVVQAVAGAPGPRANLRPDPGQEPPRLDEIPPDDEFLVRDADASQRTAIRRVMRGESGVVHGPPGTGKSQTIANLIAEAAAAGKRVLFVAEKKAAIEAVTKRLDEVGLGPLALDLHSAGLKRKAVAEAMGRTLEWINEALPMDGDDAHEKYERARDRLVQHSQRIHEARPETGESLFETWGALLATPQEARSPLRVSASTLEGIIGERFEEARQALERAAEAPEIFLRSPHHPWGRSDPGSAEEVEEILEHAREVGQEWPGLRQVIQEIADALEAPSPDTLAGGSSLLTEAERFHRVRAQYTEAPEPAWLEKAVRELAPAANGLGAGVWAWLSSGEYRQARRTMRRMRTKGAGGSELLREARVLLEAGKNLERVGAQKKLDEWPAHMTPDEVASGHKKVRQLRDRVGTPAEEVSLEGVPQWVGDLLEHRLDAAMVPRMRRKEQELRELGLGELVEDLRTRPVEAPLWEARLRYVWRHSHLDRIELREPDVAGFRGRSHDEAVEEFQKWDRRRTRLARERVRRRVALNAVQAMDEKPEQTALIKREARKRGRYIAVRRLFEGAGDVLTRIVPCWIASPLTVSEFLDSTPKRFDLVVFDEGSQVPPEDAIPAIYRGRQLVVAGDPDQLPPTTFWDTEASADGVEDEDYREDLEGFESILDIVIPFLPPFHLRWHYRSEDERLIAFSNHHIYDDRLITLPSANPEERVHLEVVGKERSGGGQASSASAEVDRVVELALAHARTRPEESLGIITFGDRHRQRVERALDEAVAMEGDMVREFFAFDRRERAFVKNLETVQGDERDAIVLSVGYGWDPNGNLPHRFGPLTQGVGYRRLNVAVSRARKRMTLVSSFRSEHVDLNRAGSRGVRLLKEFLDYADSGGRRIGKDPLASQEPLNAFERDIKTALEARGMNLVGQYGTSKYRIDLVATHPERPGVPVLAIECDGATYHSSPSARDRDRLRQEQLERLGWRFHRIWSTDWFYRREDEIERAVAAYQRAIGNPDGTSSNDGMTREEEPEDTDDWQPEPSVSESRSLPALDHYESIQDIPPRKLIRLGRAILSDGRPRPLEDLVEEMFQATPFARRGRRIMDRLEEAAKQARASMKEWQRTDAEDPVTRTS